MIVTAIITFIANMVLWFLNLLPNANSTYITGINNAVSTLTGWLTQWNNVFPVDTLFQVLGIMLIVELGLFIWKLYRWIAGIISGGIIKS